MSFWGQRNSWCPVNVARESEEITTSFPGLSYKDEGRDEKALVWAGQFCILIG
jgi:hypothetical protein